MNKITDEKEEEPSIIWMIVSILIIISFFINKGTNNWIDTLLIMGYFLFWGLFIWGVFWYANEIEKGIR